MLLSNSLVSDDFAGGAGGGGAFGPLDSNNTPPNNKNKYLSRRGGKLKRSGYKNIFTLNLKVDREIILKVG